MGTANTNDTHTNQHANCIATTYLIISSVECTDAAVGEVPCAVPSPADEESILSPESGPGPAPKDGSGFPCMGMGAVAGGGVDGEGIVPGCCCCGWACAPVWKKSKREQKKSLDTEEKAGLRVSGRVRGACIARGAFV